MIAAGCDINYNQVYYEALHAVKMCKNEYDINNPDDFEYYLDEYSDGLMDYEEGVSILHLAVFANSTNFVEGLMEVCI